MRCARGIGCRLGLRQQRLGRRIGGRGGIARRPFKRLGYEAGEPLERIEGIADQFRVPEVNVGTWGDWGEPQTGVEIDLDAGESRLSLRGQQPKVHRAAARIASRHTASLLYPPGEVERHLAPYAARYDANVAVATKEREPNDRRRRRSDPR